MHNMGHITNQSVYNCPCRCSTSAHRFLLLKHMQSVLPVQIYIIHPSHKHTTIIVDQWCHGWRKQSGGGDSNLNFCMSEEILLVRFPPKRNYKIWHWKSPILGVINTFVCLPIMEICSCASDNCHFLQPPTFLIHDAAGANLCKQCLIMLDMIWALWITRNLS